MERTTRDGNLRGGIHQTDKPIILVVVWGPCNGKKLKSAEKDELAPFEPV